MRTAVQDYLGLQPPHEQAAHLLDVLNLFAKADDEVSKEERVVVEEVNGLIEQYVSSDTLEHPMHEVLIVPQNQEQFEAVEALIPGAQLKEKRGGKVFSQRYHRGIPEAPLAEIGTTEQRGTKVTFKPEVRHHRSD